MNIYLKIEILNRELESRLLLSFFASQNNHNIIIANESFFRKAAKLNKRLNKRTCVIYLFRIFS